jgi:hypothetical protein
MAEPAESGDWDDGVPVELYAVPPEEPGDPEPPFDGIEEAIRAVRNRNAADGHLAMCILHELRTTRGEALPVRDLVAGELAPALGIGIREATRRIDVTEVLADKLPTTLRMAERGDLSWDKATALADEVAPLTREQARKVEEATLPHAARRTAARHADAVRRAVARIDPDGVAARRKQARRDIRLVRLHHGDGMGQLFAEMGSEQLDTVWLGADMWARARKAAGDPRTLDQLRVAALVQWAQSYLHHGDPAYCDRWCSPGSHDANTDERPVSRPPTRHGRPGVLHVLWDLTSLLGLTNHCGELTDSGAMLPSDAVADMVAGGVKIRRMLIDDDGELVDLTARTWRLRRTRGTELDAPVLLGVLVDKTTWQALTNGTADPALLAALAAAPRAVQDMLACPLTADELDDRPDAYPAPSRLAEFVAMRDRHPTNPTAGTSAASAADIEHPQPFVNGGRTVRANATAVVRYWHRLKTFGGWTVERHGRGWLWTSPKGRQYVTGPYDYRLGP